MSSKSTSAHRTVAPDADLDVFVAAHHDEIAAQLAVGRDEVLRGEATPLEPLEDLLRDARAAR
ncbi:hypothetical protein [Phenylobacterium aquaticum]|uniref:hypothetical protein n=1 Tax=Phenylobacterium aquaticum TaxID=1763816 RepID=UPI001F5D8582|nr:hypothetical protein [Phenylobacterium aquaticum]MCI3134601.1 hypothetical protein [Phenylobacterium aquaticum]